MTHRGSPSFQGAGTGPRCARIRGLTQRDLAARMSTSQAAVARLEAGGTSATLATLHKAAAAIDMTVTVDLVPAH